MKKFKILWLSHSDVNHSLNSSDRGWVNMLLDEIKSEVDLHVAVIEGKPDQLINGATKHIIKSRFRKIRVALHILYGYRNTEGNLEFELVELIKKVKPDLIHIHGTEKQFIRIVPFLNKANIPYLISLQGLISVVSKNIPQVTLNYSSASLLQILVLPRGTCYQERILRYIKRLKDIHD